MITNQYEKEEDLARPKAEWLEEIVRETEHYYQSEMQHDQRASWLLATSGVVVAIAVSLEATALDRGISVAWVLLMVALVAFALSAVVAILTLFPLQGIRITNDLSGKRHRDCCALSIDQLIEARFRHSADWSMESLESRIKHHYRSHYLRASLKAYGVLWSSVFLLLGLLVTALSAICILW